LLHFGPNEGGTIFQGALPTAGKWQGGDTPGVAPAFHPLVESRLANPKGLGNRGVRLPARTNGGDHTFT